PLLLASLPPSAECSELGLRARVGMLSWGWRFGCSEAEAREILEEGKKLAADLDDPKLLILLIWGYATIRGFAGDLREDVEHGLEAMALADRVGDCVLS